jgi:hypothetical protein
MRLIGAKNAFGVARTRRFLRVPGDRFGLWPRAGIDYTSDARAVAAGAPTPFGPTPISPART